MVDGLAGHSAGLTRWWVMRSEREPLVDHAH